MSELDRHEDLSAYLIGALDPAERASFSTHFAVCTQCQLEARELSSAALALERLEPPYEVPAGLQARVLAAVAAAADRPSANGSADSARGPAEARGPSEVRREQSRTQPRQPRGGSTQSWPRLAGLGLAGAAALAVVVIGLQIGGESAPTDDSAPIEIEGALTTPQGAAGGDLVVRLLGSGREISFESERLPILPKGELYELWFVGPGDSAVSPNRISAGTFHPDRQAVTDVTLHAAVDPALYPRIEVTAEPGDGDPAVAGEVVLELDAAELIEQE